MKKSVYFFLLSSLMGGNLLAQDVQVPIIFASSTQKAWTGEDVFKCIDGDNTTMYHTDWYSVGVPDQLDFTVATKAKSVSSITYVPRTTARNGIWTNVDIYYSTRENPDTFVKINQTPIVWAADNTEKQYVFPQKVDNPYKIRVNVNAGVGNFSSCAEMKIFSSEALATSSCGLDASEFVALQDIKVTPSVDGSTASNYQSGEDITKSFDGNLNTLYHTNWYSGAEVFPVTLNYRFDGNTPIDYLRYIPRQSGNNGHFGNVEILYNTIDDATYRPLKNYNFNQKGIVTDVKFDTAITPLNIMIKVLDGFNDFASCAEMEFYRKNPNALNPAEYAHIFKDDMFAELKEGVTQEQINGITSPFFRGLAQCMFDGTYKSQYRSGQYENYKTIPAINREYKIGNYSFYENATGILLPESSQVVVFAKNITDENPVNLRVRDFEKQTSVVEASYKLKNGINLLNITNKGLAYVSYYSDKATAQPVSINITGGEVNGVFKTGKTTPQEWAEFMDNAVYKKVDVIGHYTNLMLDKAPLKNFHADTAQPLVDKYDMIAKSQREMMGFFKYGKNFKNRQFVYTDTTANSGWYAGYWGVHLDLNWGLANSLSATRLDTWGVPHELGHINQVRDDIKWHGTTEVTTNIYSLWAAYHLSNDGVALPKTRLETDRAEADTYPNVAMNRYGEHLQTSFINKQHCQKVVGNQNRVFRTLIPFWQLIMYYQLAGASKDAPTLPFDKNMADELTNTAPVNTTHSNGVDYAAWHGILSEKARTTNTSSLTPGQHSLNFVKNVCDAVKEDLTEFFTHSGFLYPIDENINDYGNRQFTVTQEMIDEAKAYVQSKGYPKPVSPVMHYMTAYTLDKYKNKLPLSGTTGEGYRMETNGGQTFAVIDNSRWPNAVAFETLNASGEYMSVAVTNTGDTTHATTHAYFPDGTHSVWAVGYDGSRILVFPQGATHPLSTDEVAKGEFRVYPNPVTNGADFQVQIPNPKGEYSASLYDMSGRLIYQAKGSAEKINQALKGAVSKLVKGGYILSLSGKDDKYQTKIIKN